MKSEIKTKKQKDCFMNEYRDFLLSAKENPCLIIYRELNGCDYENSRKEKFCYNLKISYSIIKWCFEDCRRFRSLLNAIYFNHYENCAYFNGREITNCKYLCEDILLSLKKEYHLA